MKRRLFVQALVAGLALPLVSLKSVDPKRITWIKHPIPDPVFNDPTEAYGQELARAISKQWDDLIIAEFEKSQ